jgi:hypothetical protein
MRDLITIKETRDKLRNDLVSCSRKREEISEGKSFKELSEYNQEVYIFLTKSTDIMRFQIGVDRNAYRKM